MDTTNKTTEAMEMLFGMVLVTIERLGTATAYEVARAAKIDSELAHASLVRLSSDSVGLVEKVSRRHFRYAA